MNSVKRGNFPHQDKGGRRQEYYQGKTIPLPVLITGPCELYGDGVMLQYVAPSTEAEMHTPLGAHATEDRRLAASGIYEPLR